VDDDEEKLVCELLTFYKKYYLEWTYVTSAAISVEPYKFNKRLPIGAASKNCFTNLIGNASPSKKEKEEEKIS
jgi:hypothetical protein